MATHEYHESVRIGKKSQPLFAILLAVLSFFYSCTSSAPDDGTRTILLAHAMHPSHPVSIAMENIPERAHDLSNGKLRVKIYPAGQLGGERKLLELIQIGTIGMTKVSAATLENIVPAMRVFSLPYLFRDEDHVWQILNGDTGRALLEEGTPYRLKGIAYYDAGSRSLYTTRRAVHHPDDLSGLKIRVTESVIAVRMMRMLGGSPTPIAYGELYTAFQGGIVDGAENNPPSFHTSRHYEVCDYYILNRHTTIPDVLVIGTPLWQSLSADERQWLQQAVDESVAFQRDLWKKAEKEAMQVFREAGVTIIEPDPEPFREALAPLYEEIRTRDPGLHKWVEQIGRATSNNTDHLE